MNIKQLVKNVLGQSNWNRTVSTVKYGKSNCFFLLNHVQKMQVSDEWAASEYSVPKRHTFFGYYDIQQFNEKENKLLAHVVAKKAKTSVDKAQIGYFNVNEKEFHEVATTRAWCWQQGARLRWHPILRDCIVFNDVEEDHYISKTVNVDSGEVIQQTPMALYDFDSDFTFGLSLNFARLQRLRPGYGYDTLPDVTENDNAPSEDGIFYVDLKNNKTQLIVSLSSLAAECDPDKKYEHYINHISISPDGSRFMFFHIYTISDGVWKTRLCVYSMNDGTINVLEETDKVSHYDWRGNHELLVTCYTPEKKQYYAVYNVINREKSILASEYLQKDGHPSFFADTNRFISDTYPLANQLQHLFEYNMEEKGLNEIVSAYSSPLMYGEKRCDMHPRLSVSEQYISFDSTFSENRRKIVLLKRK